MNRKIIIYVAVALMVISVPILITTLATESVAFSETFYLRQYQRLSLGQSSGFSLQEFKQFSRTLHDYFRGRIPSPQLFVHSETGLEPLYKQREIYHLADVRHLFRLEWKLRNLGCILLIMGLGLVLAVKRQQSGPIIAMAIAGGSSIGIVAFLLLLLVARLNFNQAFTIFHLISFDNTLWQLDPSRHNLIKLFPEQFFLNATMAIIIQALGVLIVLLIASLGFHKKQQRESG
ncbi:MAG TPA: TIGR01906 family membrane protein [bacterium]|jgi:integral membrane protein (TIGR01906 family)|nr:TIGR01906 family membrane protein [bacterium]